MSKFNRSLAFTLIVAQLAVPCSALSAESPVADSGGTLLLDDDPLKQGQKTIDLPEIGDSTGTLFTPLQEKQLGEAFFRSLHNEVDINQDPEVSEFIQNIGQKLAGNSDNPSQAFHFFVVSDPSINAFAGPGGYIGVNSGLIISAESESELASVLAHEIAHVTQRHLYQAYQAASRLSLPTAAAMLAAIALGAATGSGQVGQAAILAAQAANTQFQINFTRDNEAEADRVGMQTLSRSTFDPRAMPLFFERLQQSTRYAGRNLPEFLLTHPVTVSRIADTRARAEKFPYRQYPDSFLFQLMRAKLRVQVARSPREALDYFHAVSGQGTPQQQEVAQYGLALALIAAGQFAEGKQLLLQLSQRHPDQPHFINALAHAEYELKNYQAALKLHETALQRFPGNRAVTLNYIKALLATKRAQQARNLLQDYAQQETPSAEVYELLAQAYSDLGQEAESHRYLAEHYYATGQTRAAILQLKIARKSAGDSFYINAVIDERLKQFMEEEAERRKQK